MALTREQSIELGAVIESRRRALLAELREDVARARGESFAELAGTAPDPGDQSVADMIADLDQAAIAREVEELRTIEAARERIREGSYGDCAACGLEIDYARLRANPSALRCIECQRKYEKDHGVASLRPGNPPTL